MATEYNIRVTASTSDADSKIQKTKKELDELGDVARESAKKTEKGFNASGVAIDELDKKTDGLASKFLGVVDAAKQAALSIKAMAAATIIGAVIAAAVAVVFYFKEMNRLVTETADKLKNETTKSLNLQVSLLEKQIKLGNLQGKQTEEIQKQRVAILKQIKDRNDREIDALETQILRLEATKLERNIWQQIEDAAIGAFLGQEEVAKRQALRIGQNIADIELIRNKILQLRNDSLETEIAIFNALNPTSKTKDKKREKQKSVGGAGLDPTGIQEDEQKRKQDLEDALFDITDLSLQRELLARRKAAEEQMLIDQMVAEAKEEILMSGIENAQRAFGFLSLLDRKSRLLQAVALLGESATGIAKIVINTRAANAAATLKYALLPGGEALAQAAKLNNNISAGIGIASNVLATTKALAALKSGGGAGLSTSLGGDGGGGPRAPQFNLVKGTDSNQIQEGIQGQQRPLKAFVVGEDMTTQQQLDRRIASDSSI